MPSLVSGVNAAKTHPEREFDECRSAVFLPSCAVEKIGNE
jgi:hypothetical protein